jgi:hypothetical protein
VAFAGLAEDKVSFAVQTYVDGVVFISREPEEIKEMLKVLEHFVDWLRREINMKACVTASYLTDTNRHQCSLAESLKFKGRDIPNLALAKSLKYLQTTMAARRRAKPEAMTAKLTEMKIRMKKIMDWPLSSFRKSTQSRHSFYQHWILRC